MAFGDLVALVEAEAFLVDSVALAEVSLEEEEPQEVGKC